MIPKSIRWRLPLSYAAIALLATLALGSVLLTTLRRYYRQQELDYLTNNAQAISAAISRLYGTDPSPETLRTQLRTYSFLSQTRVGLLDPAGLALIADSGPPYAQREVAALPLDSGPTVVTSVRTTETITAVTDVETEQGTDTVEKEVLIVRESLDPGVAGGEPGAGLPIEGAGEAPPDVIAITVPRWNDGIKETTEAVPTSTAQVFFTRAVGTLYGFGLNTEIPADERRSDLVVRQPYYDPTGKLLGQVELSEGPAYGRQILNSVTRGWVLAGGVAVLLAAGAGWLASRRLTRPLLALTGVTSHMAGGDLSARADVARQDELGQLARSYNRMAAQVEETVSTLRRFLADAAHALHTPLTALRTNLELVADEESDGQRAEFVTRAQAQIERLQALTDGLLDLSRLETVAVTEDHQPVELTALVRESSEWYASRAEQAGLAFSLQLPEKPVTVRGQPAHLRQVLGNLLDNAIKFTPAGGQVSLGLRQEGAWATLRVEDTGIGIPAADLPGLFNRFHRGRNAAAYPGSGLGLAIVKAIVSAHGGQVTAESGAEGTRFEVRLPAG